MIPELVDSFDRTAAFLRDQVSDLTDAELILQPPGVINHAAWTLGHVIFSCQAIAGEIGVEAWLPADWESEFGYGSKPATAMSERSRKAALLLSLEEASRRLRTALLAIDERSLADPLPDEQTRKILPTKGHALLQVVAGHMAYHAGQLAVWRSAIGRHPISVFL